MRPVTISPCNACAMALEHDQDPRTVLCGRCQGQLDKLIQATKPPPPEPPPMRSYTCPTWAEPGYRVITGLAIFAVGFLLGWIGRGGA